MPQRPLWASAKSTQVVAISGKDEAQACQSDAHAHEQAHENVDRFHRFLRQSGALMETSWAAQSQ
jgi:uncharacterized protein HemY